jgi:hypothetical protein
MVQYDEISSKSMETLPLRCDAGCAASNKLLRGLKKLDVLHTHIAAEM